jgi:Uma2 family endonuclease
MAPIKRPATYADIEALPEGLNGEIIDGELIVSPRPRPRHGETEGAIFADLLGPFHRGKGGPGGWWISIEPELHLDPHVLIPDIAGWRRERLPVLPETVGIAVAPDWLCEVLSPTTARIDRRKKLRIYGEQGVPHVWLVDPLLRTLEVYRRRESAWILVDTCGDDDRVRIEPFEAIELDLAGWWLPPPATGAAEEAVPWGVPAPPR